MKKDDDHLKKFMRTKLELIFGMVVIFFLLGLWTLVLLAH